MGGWGSGGWYRSNKKSTVEESLVFGVRDLRNRLIAGAAGTLTWTWNNGSTSSIGYSVTGGYDWRTITLHYRWRDKENVSIPIRLEATPTQFGGRRRWFVCPLSVGGIACNRRAGKVYLPPGAKYFGCRKCHDLTYRSCQQAHQIERLLDWRRFAAQAARWQRRYK
jgi:hypothetical protein